MCCVNSLLDTNQRNKQATLKLKFRGNTDRGINRKKIQIYCTIYYTTLSRLYSSNRAGQDSPFTTLYHISALTMQLMLQENPPPPQVNFSLRSVDLTQT